MVRGRRLGRIGVVLVLGVAIGLGTAGCSRKSSKANSGEEPALGAEGSLMGKGRARPAATPLVTTLPASGRAMGVVPVSGSASASELYVQARNAWLAGECEKSIRFARQANRIKFSTRHVSIIGACACSLRRPATAKWAYKILRGGQRNMLIQVCRHKGIDVAAGVAADPQPAPAMDPMPAPWMISPHRRSRPIPVDPNSARHLYSRARSAWLAGQCSKAMRLAKKANIQQPSARHWSIIGACACSLRRKAEAKRALAAVRGGQRRMIIQICRAKGIHLK